MQCLYTTECTLFYPLCKFLIFCTFCSNHVISESCVIPILYTNSVGMFNHAYIRKKRSNSFRFVRHSDFYPSEIKCNCCKIYKTNYRVVLLNWVFHEHHFDLENISLKFNYNWFKGNSVLSCSKFELLKLSPNIQ